MKTTTKETAGAVISRFLKERGIIDLDLEGYEVVNADKGDGKVEFVRITKEDCACPERPALAKKVNSYVTSRTLLFADGNVKRSQSCNYTKEFFEKLSETAYKTVAGKEFPEEVTVEKEVKIKSEPVSCDYRISRGAARLVPLGAGPETDNRVKSFKIILAAFGETNIEPTFFKTHEAIIKALKNKFDL